jgi:hypothetical protein
VQDFVNTEVPVWAPGRYRDARRARRLAPLARARGGEALVWTPGRSRARARFARSCASSHVATRTDDELGADLRETFAGVTSKHVYASELDERGDPRLEPDGDGVDVALAQILARVLEAHAAGTWGGE